MRNSKRERRIKAPLVTATLLVLLAIGVGYGGRAGIDGASRSPVGEIRRTRAVLADAECEFEASVRLSDYWSSVTFSMRQDAVRKALVELLQSKSAYMVDSSQSREALRFQMLGVVNEVIGEGRAKDLEFTDFDVF